MAKGLNYVRCGDAGPHLAVYSDAPPGQDRGLDLYSETNDSSRIVLEVAESS